MCVVIGHVLKGHADAAFITFYSWLHVSRQEGNEQLEVSE